MWVVRARGWVTVKSHGRLPNVFCREDVIRRGKPVWEDLFRTSGVVTMVCWRRPQVEGGVHEV